MAHFWLPDATGQWAAAPLAGPESNLREFLARASETSPAASLPAADAFLVQTDAGAPSGWAILEGQECGIAVNGLPLQVGIRVLVDRDDIRWGPDGVAFYSTEELATVTPLPEGDRKLFCPRCKQELLPKTQALKCAGCGIWYHQSDELPCYTYAEQCATCAHETKLDGGYDWIPEEM